MHHTSQIILTYTHIFIYLDVSKPKHKTLCDGTQFIIHLYYFLLFNGFSRSKKVLEWVRNVNVCMLLYYMVQINET